MVDLDFGLFVLFLWTEILVAKELENFIYPLAVCILAVETVMI